MKPVIYLLILLLFVVTASCYPIRMTSECKERISHCLANCDEGLTAAPNTPGTDDWDSRQDCVRRCHNLCSGLTEAK